MSPRLRADTDLSLVLAGASCVVLAVPCQNLALFLREHRDLFPAGTGIVCASKGVELGTFRTMGQVVSDELAGLAPRYAVLSGPSFASEVVANMPTAVALGCSDPELADLVQGLFSTRSFRVYVNSDVVGVELGGAVKNIMAIASGISDGLGFDLSDALYAEMVGVPNVLCEQKLMQWFKDFPLDEFRSGWRAASEDPQQFHLRRYRGAGGKLRRCSR